MLTVEQTEKLVLNQTADYGNEIIPFDMALGRILAETIKVGDAVISPGKRITPLVIGALVLAGELEVRVKRLPKVVIISSDNQSGVKNQPVSQQLKSPQSYLLQAALKEQGIESSVLAFPVDIDAAKSLLQQCLHNFDVILCTQDGEDHLLPVFGELFIEEITHITQAGPSYSFYLGKHENGTLAFVFQGGAEVTLNSFNQCFIPWLNASLMVVE